MTFMGPTKSTCLSRLNRAELPDNSDARASKFTGAEARLPFLDDRTRCLVRRHSGRALFRLKPALNLTVSVDLEG